MDVRARRETLAHLLQRNGELTYHRLAALFDVSHMTIRRDADALVAESLVRKIPGGLLWVGGVVEPSLAERSSAFRLAKSAVATAGADLVISGQRIFVDAGSTMVHFAAAVARVSPDIEAVTPGIDAARALAGRCRVTMLGGNVRSGEQSVVGRTAERQVVRSPIDVAFLGAAGVHVRRGVTDYDVDEIRVKRAALDVARRVVILVDGAKLGQVSTARVCPLAAVDTVITDAPATHSQIRGLREAGIEVRTVEQPGNRPQ